MRDRIAAAASSITSLASRRSEATRASTFHERADALAKPAEALTGHCQRLRLLRKHGVGVSLQLEPLRSLQGQAAELRQSFAQNPESILAADQQRFNTFWKPLKGAPDQVESDLRLAWSAWVDQAVPGGEKELLDVLDKFPSFREPVQVIRGGQVEERRLAADLPTGDTALTAVALLAERMSKAWDRLNSAQVSADVLLFLKKAATKEATLADYTPDVMQWVQENDLLKSFQITVGGK